MPGVADPVVTYKLTERDWRRLRDGARMLAQALFAAGRMHHDGWADADAVARDLAPLPPNLTLLMTIHPKSGTWGVALSDRIGGLGRDGNGSERMGSLTLWVGNLR